MYHMTFSHLEEHFKESIRRLGGIQNKFENLCDSWVGGGGGVSLETAHLILCLRMILYFSFSLSLLFADFDIAKNYV